MKGYPPIQSRAALWLEFSILRTEVGSSNGSCLHPWGPTWSSTPSRRKECPSTQVGPERMSTVPPTNFGGVQSKLGRTPVRGPYLFHSVQCDSSDEQPLLRVRKRARLENMPECSSKSLAFTFCWPECIANSLFCNILPASPYGSRFCPCDSDILGATL